MVDHLKPTHVRYSVSSTRSHVLLPPPYILVGESSGELGSGRNGVKYRLQVEWSTVHR